WIRRWVDPVVELAWKIRTEDNTDLAAARAVLDADHAGLQDVKDRILEYLAVRNRRAARGLQVIGGRGSRAVLALGGPPGVGKTRPGGSGPPALGPQLGPGRPPARSAASWSGCRSAASGTRRRSAGTGAPTWARCRAGSCGPSARPDR